MKGLFNSDDEPLEPETSIDIYYGVWFTWLLDKEWFNFEPEPIISIYYSVWHTWYLEMADRAEPFVVQIAVICCVVTTLASIRLSTAR